MGVQHITSIGESVKTLDLLAYKHIILSCTLVIKTFAPFYYQSYLQVMKPI